jgi:hypothetical protein
MVRCFYSVGTGASPDMSRWKRAGLIIVLVPLYLLAFTVIHETGHTWLARLFGDPDSTFYLVLIGPGGRGMCLGCNITDHTKLSPIGNLVVSLGGLLFTQATALAALVLLRYVPARTLRRRLVAAVALGFAFLDVPVQAVQGLLYNIERHTWPTNVDLMDAMLLISAATGAPQLVLKALLAVTAAVYLYFVWRSYRRVQAIAPAQSLSPV